MKMNWYRWVLLSLLFLLLLTLQGSVVSRWFPPGWLPELLLACSIAIGVWRGAHAGAVGGFALGFAEGILQGSHVAQFTISRMSAGFLAGLFSQEVFSENWLTPPLCALLGTVLAELLFAFLSPDLLISPGIWREGARITAVEACYNVFLAPMVFLLLRRYFSSSQTGRNLS